jgi:hypothetical protein
LILAILFLSATQLFGLGVLGEYLGRLFEETKNRPMFIVETALNIDVTPAMAGDSMADVSSPDKRSV